MGTGESAPDNPVKSEKVKSYRPVPEDSFLVVLQMGGCLFLSRMIPFGVGLQFFAISSCAYLAGVVSLYLRARNRPFSISDRALVLGGFVPVYMCTVVLAPIVWYLQYPVLRH